MICLHADTNQVPVLGGSTEGFPQAFQAVQTEKQPAKVKLMQWHFLIFPQTIYDSAVTLVNVIFTGTV